MSDKGLASASTAQDPAFREEFESVVQHVRGALTELLTSAGADVSQPQVVARQLDINRNLAWKLSKIVHATDGATAVAHLPGASGLRILLEACAAGGSSEASLFAVRRAMDDFDRMVARHAGDRAGLILMLSSMGEGAEDAARQEASRKLAFQGNSAVWGIQAKVRMGSMLLAPNADDPDWVDTAAVGGLFGFRRLRPTASWPLVRNQSFSNDSDAGPPPARPLDPDVDPGDPPLLRAFCTAPHADIRAVPVPGGTLYELCEGPVGNTAALDVVFGRITPRIGSVYASSSEDHAHHFVPLSTPVEVIQVDLLVHADLPFHETPEVLLYSRMEGGPDVPQAVQSRYVLPVSERVQNLGRGRLATASPHVKRYGEIMRYACERADWDIEAFAVWRLVLKYPPIPTVPGLTHPLIRRPR